MPFHPAQPLVLLRYEAWSHRRRGQISLALRKEARAEAIVARETDEQLSFDLEDAEQACDELAASPDTTDSDWSTLHTLWMQIDPSVPTDHATKTP
jgi:hypothetical protein